MKNHLIISLFAVALLLFGCAQQASLGSDRDPHGCIPSAGYAWCEGKQKCLRAWEEGCTQAGVQCTTVADCGTGAASCINGTCSQYDAHGCTPAGGYTWCDLLQQCIRPWEINCTIGNLAIYTESFPPFSYMGADGSITGQSTEVVDEIINRTGQGATMELKDFSQAYDLTLIGPYTALYSTARNPLRENKFQWVGPIGSWEYTIYAKAGSNLSLASLEAAKTAGNICVVRGDARHQFLLENNFSNIVTEEEDGLCAQRLAAGNISLWFGSSSSFAGIVEAAGLKQTGFKVLLSLPAGDMYIAFNKKVPASLVAEWQSALDAMKSDGTYDAIVAKYGQSQSLIEQARQFCGKENIDSVYICGEYVRTVGTLIGGGSTFYGSDGVEMAKCPVLAPDQMSAQCRLFLLGNNCVEIKIC